MNVEVVKDFRYRFRGGGYFSSKDSGFIFVRGVAPPGTKSKRPPLELYRHSDFTRQMLALSESACG